MIHLYTGNGKGKTTAALGLLFRALGRNWPVAMVQFLKGRPSGEHETAKRLGLVIHYRPSDVAPWDAKLEDLKESCSAQLFLARQIMADMSQGLLILDEIIGAIGAGALELSDVLALLDQYPGELELVLTGRNAPEELVERADLVTEMKKIKHPFDKGIQAREGIEF